MYQDNVEALCNKKMRRHCVTRKCGGTVYQENVEALCDKKMRPWP